MNANVAPSVGCVNGRVLANRFPSAVLQGDNVRACSTASILI